MYLTHHASSSSESSSYESSQSSSSEETQTPTDNQQLVYDQTLSTILKETAHRAVTEQTLQVDMKIILSSDVSPQLDAETVRAIDPNITTSTQASRGDNIY